MSELKIECPECHAVLTVDPQSGEVLAHEKPEKKPASLEEMLARQKEGEKVRKEKFAAALDQEKHKKDLLAKKFSEALSNFEDDGERPETPFDWD